ncbi:uncharacterized protein [Nicotiana sylvestris]
MDVIEPIKPKASNGHGSILVAIDYFTKWVEAITLKVVTTKVAVDFVHSNIICRFSIPKTIIIDNAANLNNHLMKEYEKNLKLSITILLLTSPKLMELLKLRIRTSRRFLGRWSKGLDNGTRNCLLLFWDTGQLSVHQLRNALLVGLWHGSGHTY